MGRRSVSRSRGYAFESGLTRQINRNDGWYAARLGGTTVELPDIIAIHNGRSMVQVYELKSGLDGALYVPAHQVRRCLDWCDILRAYGSRGVVLSFRFHAAGRNGRRPKKEYHFVYALAHAADVKCHYDGMCKVSLGDGRWSDLVPADEFYGDMFSGRA